MRRYLKYFLPLLILLLALCGCQNAAEQEWIFDLPEPNPALEAVFGLCFFFFLNGCISSNVQGH